MKITLAIILTFSLLVTSGCTKLNKSPNISEQDSSANNLKPLTQQDNSTSANIDSTNTKSSNTEPETVDNPFFFKGNVSQINYKGRFLFSGVINKDIKLHINEVANLKYGKVYEIKIDSIEGIPKDRLNLGFFYIQKDKIIRIKPTEENLKMMKSTQDMPNDNVIVCQDKGMKDALTKDERGWHQYITVNGDKREYHSYNNQVETGYYESFTWEKNKGLIFYQSGFGAERDSIKIQLNNETANTDDYRKWNGNWNMGKIEGTGASALMEIKNADKSHFEFSIRASFVTTALNKDGQKFLNPHMGGIEGIAFFISINEANYTINNHPDYKMIFKMSSDNTINIEEINVKTGQEYGSSPFAGFNVRYFGNYVLSQSSEQKTVINSSLVDTNMKKAYLENLCTDNEDVLYSFKMENSSKTMSICVSKTQPDYIVYRFGTKEGIELEFPKNKDDSWKQFFYSYYLRGGGKENEGVDLNYLTFENGDYEYKVYQEYISKDGATKVGIIVTDKSTNKATDIKGLNSSVVGTLISLRRNTKIKSNSAQ